MAVHTWQVAVVHDDAMPTRPIALVATLAVVLAACGSGSDGSATSRPDITLIATTTTVPAPRDSGIGAADQRPAGDDTTPSSDASTSSVSSVSSDASTTGTVSALPSTTIPGGVVVDEPSVSDPGPGRVGDAPPTTIAAPGLDDQFVLTTSGIGSTSFGADPDGTVAFISSFLGEPTRDTGWVDPFEIGVCNGSRLRQVAWSDLQLEFGDVSDITEGRDHFYAYIYGRDGSTTASPPGLVTPENITIGSSVADLLRAYPGTQLLQEDDFSPPSFSVSDALNGRLSGLADTDFVEVIIGGVPCET